MASSNTFTSWDPRAEDYNDSGLSTIKNNGPGRNYSRSNGSEKNGQHGVYIKNVPLTFTTDNMKSLLQRYCNVHYVMIGKPNFKICPTKTYAIAKVNTMDEALSLIEKLHRKPPLMFSVQLALTAEERQKRQQDDEMKQQVANNVNSFNNERQKEPNGVISPLIEKGRYQSAGRGRAFLERFTEEQKTQASKQNGYTEQERLNQITTTNSQHHNHGVRRDYHQLNNEADNEIQTNVEVDRASISSSEKLNALTHLRPCIKCGQPSTKRCSVCKGGYCSQVCQLDDWYFHKNNCAPPPPLEDYPSKLSESSQASAPLASQSATQTADGDSSSSSSSLSKTELGDLKESSTMHLIKKGTVQSSTNAFHGGNLFKNGTDHSGSKAFQGDNLVKNATDQSSSKAFQGGSLVNKGTDQSISKAYQGELRKPHPSSVIESNGSDEIVSSQLRSQFEGMKIEEKASNVVRYANIQKKTSPSKPQDCKSGFQSPDKNNSHPKPVNTHFNKSDFDSPRKNKDIQLSKFSNENSSAVSNNQKLRATSLNSPENKSPSKNKFIKELCSTESLNSSPPKNFPKSKNLESKSPVKAAPNKNLASKSPVKTDPNKNSASKSPVKTDLNKSDIYSDLASRLEVNNIYRAVVTVFHNAASFCVLLSCEGGGKIVAKIDDYLPLCSPLFSFQVSLKQILIAQSHEDDAWYRAMVCKHSTTDEAEVCYIDFGNKECVSRMVTLPDELQLTSTPAMGFNFKLIRLNQPDSLSISCLSEITFKILEKENGNIKASLLNNNGDIIALYSITPSVRVVLDELGHFDNEQTHAKKESAHANKASSSISPPKRSETDAKKFYKKDLKEITMKLHEKYLVRPIWLEDDSLFVHILSDDKDQIMEDLKFKIETHCQKAPKPNHFEVGELVCAFISEEQISYRGEIITVRDDIVEINFIDFGNCSYIPRQDIKAFHHSLMLVPILAVKLNPMEVAYSRVVYDKISSVISELNDIRIEVSSLKPLCARMVTNSGDNIYPLENGADFASSRPENSHSKPKVNEPPQMDATELLKSGTVKPQIIRYDECPATCLPESGNVEVIVLHCLNPLNIFVLPFLHLNLFNDLQTLSQEINIYCDSFPKTYYIPQEGEVCLARYTEDGMWYRAATLLTNDTSATVTFVDYGNLEIVPFSSLCQMVDKFMKLPLLVVHCYLEGFTTEQVEGASDETKNEFKELLGSYSKHSVDVLERDDFLRCKIEIPSLRDEIRKIYK